MPPETVMQWIAAPDGGAQQTAIPLGLWRVVGLAIRRCAAARRPPATVLYPFGKPRVGCQSFNRVPNGPRFEPHGRAGRCHRG